MYKTAFVLSILVVVLITESSCQGFRIIRPTYRPPPRRPFIIRTARDVTNEQPQWLYQGDIPRAPATGDHPFLPKYIDDIKLDPNRRYARNVMFSDDDSHSESGSDTDSSIRAGSSHRHAREIRLPYDPLPRPQRPFDPFNPFPRPRPRPTFPIYV